MEYSFRNKTKSCVRIYIPTERAIELFNIIAEGSDYVVSSEEELNNNLGNGRTTTGFNFTKENLLNEIEMDMLKDSQFMSIKDERSRSNGFCICLLGVDKETYPGMYWLGDC